MGKGQDTTPIIRIITIITKAFRVKIIIIIKVSLVKIIMITRVIQDPIITIMETHKIIIKTKITRKLIIVGTPKIHIGKIIILHKTKPGETLRLLQIKLETPHKQIISQIKRELITLSLIKHGVQRLLRTPLEIRSPPRSQTRPEVTRMVPQAVK